MPAALEKLTHDDWDGLQRQMDTISQNLRQPMPNASVHRATANQAVATATVTAIIFDTVDWNVGGVWSAGSPTKLTAPITGLYLITSLVSAAAAVGSTVYTDIVLNGAGVTIAIDRHAASPDGLHQASLTAVTRLAAGQYAELRVYQDSGSNKNYLGFFTMVRLGGYENEGVAV